jgi:hypothetical protein
MLWNCFRSQRPRRTAAEVHGADTLPHRFPTPESSRPATRLFHRFSECHRYPASQSQLQIPWRWPGKMNSGFTLRIAALAEGRDFSRAEKIAWRGDDDNEICAIAMPFNGNAQGTRQSSAMSMPDTAAARLRTCAGVQPHNKQARCTGIYPVFPALHSGTLNALLGGIKRGVQK